MLTQEGRAWTGRGAELAGLQGPQSPFPSSISTLVGMEPYRVSSWKRSLQGPCSSCWAQLLTSCRGTSGMRSGP